MRNIKKFWVALPLVLLSAILYIGCQPVREFERIPVYKGSLSHNIKPISFDKSKKTVVIVAHNDGTENFDLMAPYYLFNVTEQANVYIVAESNKPIVLLKGMFIYPTTTFADFDALHIKPDVIVIPALVEVYKNPKSKVITWIKENYDSNTQILSICAGSLVASATGLYDGIPITTHASMFEEGKDLFKKPTWIQNVAVTQSDNLYSTAGVSNAVEGSLTIIKKLFGEATLQKVMNDIDYPFTEIRTEHKSYAVKTNDKFTIAKKIFFRKNKRVGILLQENINELKLAAVIDTYNRTFPAAVETIVASGTFITSKYGLTLIPSNTLKEVKLDELHVINPNRVSKSEADKIKGIALVEYDETNHDYIINQCLKRIHNDYGSKFENITKLLLDYN